MTAASREGVAIRKKGQREEDLRDFPQEEISHDVAAEELDDAFGRGNWKSMPDEIKKESCPAISSSFSVLRPKRC